MRFVVDTKNIFVTGGTGYLGRNILAHLANRSEFRIFLLKRKTTNLESFKHFCQNHELDYESMSWVDESEIEFDAFFAKQHIDFVLHCATHYGRKNDDPIKSVQANLILPLKLLHCSVQNGVRVFINTDTFINKELNHYGLSKKQFYEWLKVYSENIVAINLKLEHFYGPHDDKSKFLSFVLDELLKKSDEIKLTPGHQKRDFIYIQDVVSAFDILLKKSGDFKKGFYEFEVGTGLSVEIKQLVGLLKKMSGNKVTKLNFGALNYRSNEIMDSKVNISQLERLGWAPKVDLLSGLQLTIDGDSKRNLTGK